MKTNLIHSFFVISVVLGLSFNLVSDQYPGTNLRGKVAAWNNYALPNMKVGLWVFNPAIQQWRNLGTSFTDGRGFYYFRNVRPGNYTLQVNNNKNYKISVIKIDYRYYTYQDLPVLTY